MVAIRLKTSILLILLTTAPVVGGADPPASTTVYELYQHGYFDEARVAFLDRVRTQQDRAEAAWYIGKIAYQDEAFSEAIDWFERAVSWQTDASLYHQWLGRAYAQRAIRSGFFTKARLAGKIRKAFRQAIVHDPGNLEARIDLIRFYMAAPSFFGGRDKAMRQAQEVAQRDHKQGLRAMSFIHRADGRLDLAEAAYLESIRLYPHDFLVRYFAARFYYFTGQHERAIPQFEAALRLNPQLYEVHFFIGKSLHALRAETERGVAELQRYLQHRPREHSPQIYEAELALAQMLQHQGDHQAAKHYYLSVLDRRPGHYDAQQGLHLIR